MQPSFWITPHHSYYCCGTTFRWIGSGRSTVIYMNLLTLAWWHQHEVISIAKRWRIAKCCGITRRHRVAQCRGIAKERWLAKNCWIANYCESWRIAGLLSIAGQAMSRFLAICWLLAILLLLVDSEGVALIGLGGVNLYHSMFFSSFTPNSPVCYPTQFPICYWNCYHPYSIS